MLPRAALGLWALLTASALASASGAQEAGDGNGICAGLIMYTTGGERITAAGAVTDYIPCLGGEDCGNNRTAVKSCCVGWERDRQSTEFRCIKLEPTSHVADDPEHVRRVRNPGKPNSVAEVEPMVPVPPVVEKGTSVSEGIVPSAKQQGASDVPPTSVDKTGTGNLTVGRGALENSNTTTISDKPPQSSITHETTSSATTYSQVTAAKDSNSSSAEDTPTREPGAGSVKNEGTATVRSGTTQPGSESGKGEGSHEAKGSTHETMSSATTYSQVTAAKDSNSSSAEDTRTREPGAGNVKNEGTATVRSGTTQPGSESGKGEGSPEAKGDTHETTSSVTTHNSVTRAKGSNSSSAEDTPTRKPGAANVKDEGPPTVRDGTTQPGAESGKGEGTPTLNGTTVGPATMAATTAGDAKIYSGSQTTAEPLTLSSDDLTHGELECTVTTDGNCTNYTKIDSATTPIGSPVGDVTSKPSGSPAVTPEQSTSIAAGVTPAGGEGSRTTGVSPASTLKPHDTGVTQPIYQVDEASSNASLLTTDSMNSTTHRPNASGVSTAPLTSATNCNGSTNCSTARPMTTGLPAADSLSQRPHPAAPASTTTSEVTISLLLVVSVSFVVALVWWWSRRRRRQYVSYGRGPNLNFSNPVYEMEALMEQTSFVTLRDAANAEESETEGQSREDTPVAR